MKQLLPLMVLCLLLCGCTAKAHPIPDPPSQPTAAAVPEPTEAIGGAVQRKPLDLRRVRRLSAFQGKLLFFSGQETTVLTLTQPDTLEILDSAELPFQADSPPRFHTDGTFSLFDPDRKETVVLDGTLNILQRIPVPEAATAAPILSPEGKTLFYCTASHLQALDPGTGVRRRIKEMAFDSQILTDVLLDGTVLQCFVEEDGTEETLFLSAEDGRLLHRTEGNCRIRDEEDRFYAALSLGYSDVLLYGTEASPSLLLPEDNRDAAFFLPEGQALVTAAVDREERVTLTLYDLASGILRDTLTLGPYQMPRNILWLEDCLLLLTYDPETDQDLLYRWRPQALRDGPSHRFPYTHDLSSCRKTAEALQARWGIRILLGREAAEAAPWDHTAIPETLAPLAARELSLLEQRLEAFPEDMLRQTISHFSGLTFCLVRSLRDLEGNAVTGLQCRQGSQAFVFLTCGEYSRQALYHELFHVMETHIFSGSKAFDQWENLNPAGFRYDYDYAANALRDSGVYLFQDHRAFVDTYSMSFPREDRARIMEYAMLPGQEALFRSDTMQNKLRCLCTGIREAYGLADPGQIYQWEQYLA